MDLTRFGFGVTGDLDLNIVQELAPAVEQAGFRTMWFNDTPGGDSLACIAEAAKITSTLLFGTGVIPVDRKTPDQIVEAVQSLGIPQDRLTLGIGSSAPPSPLSRVEQALAALHAELDSPLLVGALGPKMRQLAAQNAEGLLLNWLTPSAAALAQEDKARDAEGRDVKLVLYIRTGLGDAAAKRVASEANKYSQYPAYAANFERLGFKAVDSAVTGNTGTELATGLQAFDGIVDEPVVRAITAEETLEAYLALVESLVNA